MASSNPAPAPEAPTPATPVELHVAETIDFVRARLPAGWAPEIGIVCGSGLGGLVGGVAIVASIPYAAIPHFPVSSVQGHGKALVFGTLGGKRIVALTGRFHFYEGLHPATVAYGIRCVAALGAKILVVTNAAGGVNPGYEKQDIMLIEDHISFCCLAGVHPLVGHNDGIFGPRFPAMTNAYTPALRDVMKRVAEEKGLAARLREGVYVNVAGPSYETRHEIALMRKLGGDAVGMSTVFEVLAAAHCGLQVVGMSLITNKCVAPEDVTTAAPSHAEVLEASEETGAKAAMQTLVTELCSRVNTSKIAPTPAALAFADTAAIRARAPRTFTSWAVPAAVAVGVAAAVFAVATLRRRSGR